MPTFTAIALDRFLEPGPSESVDKTTPGSGSILKSNSFSETKPPHPSRLQRRNSTTTVERKPTRLQISSPALYTTPEATPVPCSPSSYAPSPYIINHKRRGPGLLKSVSEADITFQGNNSLAADVNDSKKNHEADIVDTPLNGAVSKVHCHVVEPASQNCADSNLVKDGSLHGNNGNGRGDIAKGHHVDIVSCDLEPQGVDVASNLIVGKDFSRNAERDVDSEDFFDPQESMSYSTDGEDGAGTWTSRTNFFDAWEELSTESGRNASMRDVDAELREMRLTLIMELEKRKQAEEALNYIQGQWQWIRDQLTAVGLTFPEIPTTVPEGEQERATDLAEDLCRQVSLARYVSESIGKGFVRAEVETEMEAQLEAKDSEIARLWDRLRFYEAVNREMYQRNQEAIELARCKRRLRKRKQRWIWGSIAAAITVGAAALAWSYLPSGNDLSSAGSSFESKQEEASK